MLVIGIVLFTGLSFAFCIAFLYFQSDNLRNPKASYFCIALCLLFLIATLLCDSALKRQNQQIWERKEIEEVGATYHICFEDGNLYLPNFYGSCDLVTYSSGGLYKFNIIRSSSSDSPKVTTLITSNSETEIEIKENFHQPMVEEIILHKYLLDPFGDICYETTEEKYRLTLPPNSIKCVTQFTGS